MPVAGAANDWRERKRETVVPGVHQLIKQRNRELGFHIIIL